MIASYLEKKTDNNEIISKILENNELREKYEKQLVDLRKDEPLIKLKQNPITTTTISVNNPINSNQQIILKTLNTGTQSNQTQIKTTDALKNLITAANTNNTNTTNTNLKQVILTTKATTPKVILVPNNLSNSKCNQVEDLTTGANVQYLPATPTRVVMPKITATKSSLQKFVVLKSSNFESKSLKIITQPIINSNENQSESLKQQNQTVVTTQTSKPILNNTFNYLKDTKTLNQNNEVFIFIFVKLE